MSAVCSLVTYPDVLLSRRTSLVTSFDGSLAALVTSMRAAMEAVGAAGIAAPQVGDGRSVAIVDPCDGLPPIVMVNPQVAWLSYERDVEAEDCPSLPGLRLIVLRPVACAIMYNDADGARRTVRLAGQTARTAQHEVDHLGGLTAIDRIDALAAALARQALRSAHRVVQS